MDVPRIEGAKLGKSQRDKDLAQVASVAVYNAAGQLLFGRRNDNQKFTLPGGHLEPGEKPLAGARRELKEEAGIDLPEGRFKKLGSGDAGACLVHSFRVDLKEDEATPDGKNDPDEECSEWSWVDCDDEGVPQNVADNLHSPRNITLRLLGLQNGDVKEAPMKKSKNVRIHTSNLTENQRNARFGRLAQTMGLKLVNGLPNPQTPGEVSDFRPAARGSIIRYGGFYPAEHELAHAVMTPNGQTVHQYTTALDSSPDGRNEENAAQELEAKLGRMAGVRGVGASGWEGPHSQRVKETLDRIKRGLRFVRGRAVLAKAAAHFAQAAFRHNTTGKVIGTGPFHDLDQLPDENWQDYTDGFIDHSGQFFTREEAAKHVGARLSSIKRDRVFRGRLRSEDVVHGRDAVEGREIRDQMKKADDEISRLLDHPDPRERTMALKLSGVRRDHLIQALAHPDPAVQHLAFDHPGADDMVHTALMRMPGRLRLQREALRRDLITANHLRDLYHTTMAQPEDPDARGMISDITGHPALDGDLIREMWMDPHIPGRRGLAAHPRCPSDLLEAAVMDGLNAPETAPGRALACEAARSPALPFAARQAALKRSQGHLKACAAANPDLSSAEIDDVLAGGRIPREYDPDVQARVNSLKGWHVEGRHLDQALQDHHPAVRAAVFDSPSSGLSGLHVEKAIRSGDPLLAQKACASPAFEPAHRALLASSPHPAIRAMSFVALRPHPHAYEWHDGHTAHHAPEELGKADAPTPHPHLWNQKQAEKELSPQTPAHLPAGGVSGQNDQAAGVGVSTYAQFAGPYGKVRGQHNPSDLKHYDYAGKSDAVQGLLQQHGYQTYYSGGKYGKPDLANRNYNTKHLMIYDPEPGSGGDFGEREYTDNWRKTHELAHALVYPELNQIYDEGRRIGKLGIHRTTREAMRAVHWEWLAAHKQRELNEQIGINVPDEVFHRELNTVMHDAVHRAVTGKFTEPSGEGFEPSSEKVPLEHALGTVREHAGRLGLKGMHDLLAKPVRKSEEDFEDMVKNVDPQHFAALRRASDPKGRDMVDHRGQLQAHPAMHQRFVDNYQQTVLGSPEQAQRLSTGKRGAKGSLQGISGKVLFAGHLPEEPTGTRYMVKPYHERITRRCSDWMKHPHQGWAEMTTQALFHAGGIGHLHQAVHVAEHNMGPGYEQEPALVIKMAEGFNPVVDQAEWDEAAGGYKVKTPAAEAKADARKIGLMDFLTNNLDRHGHNLLYNKKTKQVLSIDTPRSFQYMRSGIHAERGAQGLCPHCGVKFWGTKPGFCHQCHKPTKFGKKLISQEDSLKHYLLGMAIADIDHHDPESVRTYDGRRKMMQDYEPAFDWWWEHRNKVRGALKEQLQHIRDPRVRAHIHNNFEERARLLDQMADFGVGNFGDKWYDTEVSMYRPGEDPGLVYEHEDRRRMSDYTEED